MKSLRLVIRTQDRTPFGGSSSRNLLKSRRWMACTKGQQCFAQGLGIPILSEHCLAKHLKRVPMPLTMPNRNSKTRTSKLHRRFKTQYKRWSLRRTQTRTSTEPNGFKNVTEENP